MTSLFDPLKIGSLTVKNRIFMAPLTRARAGESRIPNDLMAQYYAQRADAGLIIAEATAISEEGYGWSGAPGIYTDAHEEGWKKVTDAVHARDGHIYLQLWHMGRVSHPDFLGGKPPFGPSAIAAEGQNRSLRPPKDYVTPRAMALDDIKRTIEDYERTALRAIRAGFDGVEIHGANGYLIDQFLRTQANQRDDEYGGSADNRCRFMKDVVTAVTAAIGADKTGIRLSPENRDFNSMEDENPAETFLHATRVLDAFDLAFLHIKENSNREDPGKLVFTPKMREIYCGNILVNEQYSYETGNTAVESGLADAVVYGQLFIANPDLVERFRLNGPLNEPNPTTYYSEGAEGYTDYPFWRTETAATGA